MQIETALRLLSLILECAQNKLGFALGPSDSAEFVDISGLELNLPALYHVRFRACPALGRDRGREAGDDPERCSFPSRQRTG